MYKTKRQETLRTASNTEANTHSAKTIQICKYAQRRKRDEYAVNEASIQSEFAQRRKRDKYAVNEASMKSEFAQRRKRDEYALNEASIQFEYAQRRK